jgi:hypothetical protein
LEDQELLQTGVPIPPEVARIPDPKQRLTRMAELVTDAALKQILTEAAEIIGRGASTATLNELMTKYLGVKRLDIERLGTAMNEELLQTEYVLAEAIWEQAQALNLTPNELGRIERVIASSLDMGMGSMPEQISSVQLSSREMAEFIEDPEEWMHREWDIIDKTEQPPTNEGVIVLIQRLGLALSNMEKMPPNLISKEVKRRVQEIHKVRQGLYLMNHVLLRKDIDHAREIAQQLGMGGLFAARAMVNGGVSVAANKLAEYVERERIDRGNTVPATAIHIARQKASADLLTEAQAGAYGNQFGSTPEAIDRNVTRAMSIGYNWFIASEQMAVHVAKGDLEGGYKQIISQPFTYLSALFRIMDFSILKWEFLSPPQMAIVERAFKIMGNGDVVKGRKRFDRMISVNDLFSSIWRIEPIVRTVDLRLGSGEGRYFALGMRLKINSQEGRTAQLRETWETVAAVRPLEIAKLMKEKAMDDEKTKLTSDKGRRDQAKLQESKPWKTKEDPELQGFLGRHATLFEGITTYSQLETELAKYLYPLYANMMQTRCHIDFTHLTDQQRRIIANLGGDAVRFSAQMVALSEYAGDTNQINRLMDRTELLNRTQWVGDVPFEILEDIGALPDEKEPGPLSYFYTIGGAEEPLTRIFNDTYSALEASKHLIGFIQTRDIKHLEEMAAAMDTYISPAAAAKAVHDLASAYFSMARSKPFYAWTSLDKLPIATSELQSLFGMGEVSLDPAEMRKKIDQVNLILGRYPELENRLQEISGTSDIVLIIFVARWDILLVWAILMKEGFEQTTGQNK